MFDRDFGYMMMQSMSAMIVLSVGVMVVFLALPYVMLRVRDWRVGSRDRQLGFKVALHFLFTQAAWTGMLGLSIIISTIVLGSAAGSGMAPGAGMFLAGGLAAWGVTWAIRRSNDHAYLAVRKTYSGGRMIVAFSIGLGLFTIVLMQIMEVIIGSPTPNPGSGRYASPPPGANPLQGKIILQLSLVCLLWVGAGVADLFFFRSAMDKPELPPYEDTCGSCNYQLMGTILSKRSLCPECGAAIPTEQAQQVYLRNKHRIKPKPALAAGPIHEVSPDEI